MLFDLAKKWYNRLPKSGWAYQKVQQEVASLLCEILGIEKLRVVDCIDLNSISSGLPLSNSLFVNIPYIPPSVLNSYGIEFLANQERTEIKHWVVLGVEVAGIDLSRIEMDSCLILGRNRAILTAQSVVLDSSRISSTVFAYTNLKGLRCSGTHFDDVLMSNCVIELALFQDYLISSSLAIVSDDKVSSVPIKESVFHCLNPQNNGHVFIISNTSLQSCLFTGYFQPTELLNVTFSECHFGTEERTCFIQGLMEPEPSSKHWDFQRCEVRNTELVNLSDQLILKECNLKGSIKITGCSLASLGISNGHFSKDSTVSVNASVINKLDVSGNDDRLRIQLLHSEDGSCNVFSNPRIDGFHISGALDSLQLVVDNERAAHLKNGVFDGSSLLEFFILAEGKLELCNVSFMGKPDARMILTGVSFLNCTLTDVVFENCDFKDCVFPSIETKHQREEKSTRITFCDCLFDGDELDSVDFSNCCFKCSNDFIKSNKLRKILNYRHISKSSFTSSVLELPLRGIVFSDCVFNGTKFSNSHSSSETPLITKCTFRECSHLLLPCQVSDCIFQSVKQPEQVVALSRNAVLIDSELENCTLTVDTSNREILEAVFLRTVLKCVGICGSTGKSNRSYLMFDNCELTETRLSDLFIPEKAFQHCKISDLKVTNCLVKDKVVLESEIELLQFYESAMSELFTVYKCLLKSNYPLSFINCSSEEREQRFLTLSLAGCYFDNDEKDLLLRVSDNSFKLKVKEGFDNFSNAMLAPFNVEGIENTEEHVHLFKAEKTRKDWEKDKHLYDFDRREKLYRLWEEKGILEPIGHEILDADPEKIVNKKLYYIKSLDKIINATGIDVTLCKTSRETFNKDAAAAIELLENFELSDNALMGKFRKFKDIILKMVHGTRLRYGSKPNQDIRYWLEKLIEISRSEIKLIDIPSNTDMKFFGDYILLGDWINFRYKKNINEFHKENDYRVGLAKHSNCIVLMLGGNGQNTNYKTSRFSEFPSKEVLSMLNSAWNVLGELEEFSREWIRASDEKKLELEVACAEGRFRFMYSDRKWRIVGKRNDSSFCDGICFYIPLYGFIDNSERKEN